MDVASDEHAHQPAQARRLFAQIDAAIETLTATRAALGEALVRAHRDVDAGVQGASLTERVTQSSVQDRATAGRALDLAEKPDRIRVVAAKMVEAIGASEAMAALSLRCANALLPIAHDNAEKLAAEVTGGNICQNPHCRALITRVGNDRPRGGRCLACYEYKRVHRGVERPRELVEAALAKQG